MPEPGLPKHWLCRLCEQNFAGHGVGYDGDGKVLMLCAGCRDFLAREAFLARQQRKQDAQIRAELSDGALR